MANNYLRTKEIRLANKKAGLCRCGREPITGYKLCQSCTESNRTYSKKLAQLGLCPRCGRDRKNDSKFCEQCLESSSKRHEEWRNAIYQQILDHYGRQCACCGETNPGFLTLDHKNNDGAEQRRLFGAKGGYLYYLKVIQAGFPEDLQILCFNCNCAKNRFGFCPHTAEGMALVKRRYPELVCEAVEISK